VDEPLNADIGIPAVFDQEYYRNRIGARPLCYGKAKPADPDIQANRDLPDYFTSA
jgi:hypothetical protein